MCEVVRQLHRENSSLGGDHSWLSRKDYFKDLALAALPREGEDTSVHLGKMRKLIDEQVWFGNLGVPEREELCLAVVTRDFPRVRELYASNKELNKEAGSLGGDAAAASGLGLSSFTRKLFGVEEDGVNLQAQNNGDALLLSRKNYFKNLALAALPREGEDTSAHLGKMHRLIDKQVWFGIPGSSEQKELRLAVVQRDFPRVFELYADNEKLSKEAGSPGHDACGLKRYSYQGPITDAQLKETQKMTQRDAAAFLSCTHRIVGIARRATGK